MKRSGFLQLPTVIADPVIGLNDEHPMVIQAQVATAKVAPLLDVLQTISMGSWYTLVNLTKKEQVGFNNLPVCKESEIPGNPAGAAIVSWYLLKNSGDKIGFFGDESESPFPGVIYGDISDYPDRTDEIIESLIEEGILVDCGLSYQDEDDPSLYLRDIRNAWMPADLLVPPQKTAEAGTGLPASRPQSDLEGGDKPQPKSEGRSR